MGNAFGTGNNGSDVQLFNIVLGNYLLTNLHYALTRCQHRIAHNQYFAIQIGR